MKKVFLQLALLVIFAPTLAQSPNWLWAKNYGGTNSDAILDIITDLNGNVFTLGLYRDNVDFDPGSGNNLLISDTTYGNLFLLKTDFHGNFIWVKEWDIVVHERTFSLNKDNVDNIYVTGCFTGNVDFDPGTATYFVQSTVSSLQYFVLKLTNNGNFIWVKAFGGCYNTPVCKTEIDEFGNIYTVGMFTNYRNFNPNGGSNFLTAGYRDIFVLKLNSSGGFLWVKQITGSLNNWPYGFAVDSNNNLFITGSFSGSTDFDPGPGTNIITAGTTQLQEDVFLCKLNNSGDFEWVNTFGGPNRDYAKSVIIDGNNNILITGSYHGLTTGIDFDPGPGNHFIYDNGINAFISKFDNAGNFIFVKSIDGKGFVFANSITLDLSENIYIAGNYTDSTDFDPSNGVYYLSPDIAGAAIYILKLNAAGNFVWAESKGGQFHIGILNNTGSVVHADVFGNIYFGGKFEDPSLTFGNNTLLSNNAFSLDYTDGFIAKIETMGTSVNETLYSSAKLVSIFPNPASTELFIELKHLKGKINLNLTDVAGRKVKELNMENIQSDRIRVDLNNLKNGVYLINMQTNNGFSFEKLIICK